MCGYAAAIVLALLMPFTLIGIMLICAAIVETVRDLRDWIRRK